VFAEVTDPIAGGLIESLARPCTNATSLAVFEYGFAAKWLELLKEIAPGVKRAGILGDPAQLTADGQLGSIQAVAASLGIEAIPLDVRDAAAIERSIAAFAGRPNGGLVILTSYMAYIHRSRIVGRSEAAEKSSMRAPPTRNSAAMWMASATGMKRAAFIAAAAAAIADEVIE
jgi:putative ABC transport system substrate-binding protein